MTFVCTLQPSQQISIDVLIGGGEILCRHPIGYDDDTDDVISVLCALVPRAGGADGEFELMIVVTRASRFDDDDVTEYWDGDETRTLIVESSQRKLVLNVVLACVEALIDCCNPDIVALTTHVADLPPKALAKYQRVRDLFAVKGYQAAQGDPYHGQHIWMMQLP